MNWSRVRIKGMYGYKKGVSEEKVKAHLGIATARAGCIAPDPVRHWRAGRGIPLCRRGALERRVHQVKGRVRACVRALCLLVRFKRLFVCLNEPILAQLWVLALIVWLTCWQLLWLCELLMAEVERRERETRRGFGNAEER